MKTALRAFASVLLSLLCYTSFAQTSFYVRAGGNLSQFNSESLEYRPLSGFQAGVGLTWAISSHFAFRSELLLTSKGAAYDINFSPSFTGSQLFKSKDKDRLTYVQVPVLGLYYLSLRRSRLFFGAGPFIGVGVKGVVRSEYRGDLPVKFTSQPTNREDEYRRLDSGVTGTMGIEKNRVLVGINYDFSLLKNKAIPGYGGASGFALYNRSLGISVGYRLGKL
ncbi:MAG: PorT family protein [Bacteroidetes bacterium]|nr:PorT family protein [Bacteroidota bacterium]